jgi:hypothetical protein
MDEVINIYCDESCHLERDGLGSMVIGAVWCPKSESRNIARRIREIKKKHGLHPRFEIKWTKVSPARLGFYTDLIDYFFDDDALGFRAIIVPDKTKLDHDRFGQDHNTFYYKMYFDMLKILFSPHGSYQIFIDIKDTRGAEKVRELHQILCNAHYDFDKRIIKRVQQVESQQVEQQQLADLLIGCVSYAVRDLKDSPAKLALVQRVRVRSRYSLTRTTLMREQKFNLLRWNAQE